MMILTNVTFGLWCFGATNAWLKNGYLWIKNDIFELKWSEFYKKTENGYSREKIIFNHALRITFWVRYYFDRNKKNAKRSLAPIDFVTIISVSKVRPQALRIKNQFKKSIFSRNREIFEFKWERNWLSKNLDPALYRVGFDIMFKNI